MQAEPEGRAVIFDRSRLHLRPLAERVNDLDLSVLLPLERREQVHPRLREVARLIAAARAGHRPVVMMIGAHVLRSGVQRYLIDLLERGRITCLAMNGAGVIHDFELALIGATTESVARYIAAGQFGLWSETGRINEIVNAAAAAGGEGLGAAVGRAIEEGDYPHREISVLAACSRLGVPATVHVAIGQDIIHEHPNFDPCATAALSYRDFLRLAGIVEGLAGGVLLSFGSAVMAPEVFLKALSMARNAAGATGGSVTGFSTLVCDLLDLPEDTSREAVKGDPGYYFRPWKTLLARTVAGDGRGYYVRGRHAETIPGLWSALADLGAAD